MKKLLIALLIFAVAAGAVYKGLVVSGGPFVEVPVTIAPDDVTPSVATGNIFYTGINTGGTVITDLDNPTVGATYTIICGSIAGGNQSTIVDGANFTLDGNWQPATVGDSITLFCRADNNYLEVGRAYAVAGPVLGDPFLAGPDAVGAPGHSWAADPNTGVYNAAADTVGIATGGVNQATVDATGIAAVGFNGPIGTVVPAAGTFTDVNVMDDFNFGQAPDALIIGFKERGDTVLFSETFTTGVDATYALDWDLTGVVGAGTNTVTVRDGWSELVTGGAGGPDVESTVSFGLANYRAYAPRIESVIELTGVAGQRFSWGFYAAGNEFVEIVHDTAIGANWYLQVDDTTGVETIDSGVVVTADPTKLEIQVDAAGDVHWAIDDVAMTEVGLTNVMTANAHYHRWILTDIAAAAHTVAVDYFILEQLKQQ